MQIFLRKFANYVTQKSVYASKNWMKLTVCLLCGYCVLTFYLVHLWPLHPEPDFVPVFGHNNAVQLYVNFDLWWVGENDQLECHHDYDVALEIVDATKRIQK